MLLTAQIRPELLVLHIPVSARICMKITRMIIFSFYSPNLKNDNFYSNNSNLHKNPVLYCLLLCTNVSTPATSIKQSIYSDRSCVRMLQSNQMSQSCFVLRFITYSLPKSEMSSFENMSLYFRFQYAYIVSNDLGTYFEYY